jgi:aldehyde:ferredoxin oxidoreductase
MWKALRFVFILNDRIPYSMFNVRCRSLRYLNVRRSSLAYAQDVNFSLNMLNLNLRFAPTGLSALGGIVRIKGIEMKILRIDVSNGNVKEETVPEALMLLGGRAFTSGWLFDHVDPGCEPLGPYNHLVIAPGLLAGTPSSSVHRLSVGAKSPLTGGIKESNSGGIVAYKMARLDIKAVVLEGVPPEDRWSVLHIGPDGVRFDAAGDLSGKGTEASALALHEVYGDDAALMVIGPAGEHRFNSAAIFNSDREGFAARVCGRGGMGAVMASKGFKAIVIDDAGAGPVSMVDSVGFKKGAGQYLDCLRKTPQTSEIYTKFGTAAMTDVANELGGLPTLNFRKGRFDGAEKINGRTLYRTIVERGGNPSHACMPGCVICSSNIYVDASGEPIVRSLEYETLVLFGPNCGIDDLDELARINRMCNDIGVDTIELGVAVGIAMDAGIIYFGDIGGVKQLLDQVREATTLGRVLGQGAAIAGKVLGVKRIPAVKGQAMAAYEPRAIKGHGVTFATSTMGADHTAGFTIREGLDSHQKNGQVEASGRMQVNGMLYDMLGVCLFAHPAVCHHHDVLTAMVNGRWGADMTTAGLRKIAADAMANERAFNRDAGLGPSSDRLPEIFYTERNPSSGTVFDITPEALGALKYE